MPTESVCGRPRAHSPLGRFTIPEDFSVQLICAEFLSAAAPALGAAAVILGAAGCAEASAPAQAPARSLPPLTSHAVELFDDGIEPEAAGYPPTDSAPPARSVVLRERTQMADSVVRARIVTLTTTPGEAGPSWHVGLRTVETLAGAGAPDAFALQVHDADPASGILRAREGELVGSTLVVFLRAFASRSADPDGSRAAETHFHAGPDSKDEIGAVRAAALLGELR